MYRSVTLEPGWHKDAMGAMITTLKDSGTVSTVLRDSAGLYVYTDPVTGKKVRVTAAEEKRISDAAYCFYRPLPLRKITLKDLFRYMLDSVSTWDLAAFCVAAVSAAFAFVGRSSSGSSIFLSFICCSIRCWFLDGTGCEL